MIKKLLLVVTLISVGLTAGACGSGSFLGSVGTALSGVSLATKTIDNPVTPADLYQIESSVSIGFTALNTYRTQCIKGTVDKNCVSNIEAIQVYTRQMKPYLVSLRSFVRNNDQVNAITVFNQLVSMYGNAKNTAAAFGVRFGT
jgi:hypothetical protein